MTVWMHKRKGRVVGVEVEVAHPDPTWMHVTLHEHLQGARECWEVGETVTLRRSLMSRLPDVGGPS